MLRTIESPPSVLAIEVVGKLTRDDYQTVFVPGIKALLEGAGEIRVVVVFGEEYEGLTPGGIASDSSLFIGEMVHRELSKWKRCAVVTRLDWLRHSVSLFRWMMPGEVQCFDLDQVEAAIAWTAA